MSDFQVKRKINALYKAALKGLSQRVCGYTLTETKCTYHINAQGERILKDESCLCKEVGPDPASILFVLTNLAPRQWRSKPDEGIPPLPEEPSEAPDLKQLSEQALRELEKLWKKP